MTCCDTCPFYPTCEEIEDFERDVLHLDDDGYPYDPPGDSE
jgi:hypothetical protein